MGKIINEKGYIRMEITPDQLVFRGLPIPGSTESFGDLVSKTAWSILNHHAPKFVKGKTFKLRAADADSEKFIITFYEEGNETPAPPTFDAEKP